MKKGTIIKAGMLCLALLVVAGATGITYGAKPDTGKDKGSNGNGSFTWVVSNDDGTAQTVSRYGVIDPGDNGNDPYEPQELGMSTGRYRLDVASTTAEKTGDEHIVVTITNGYPRYLSTVFFGVENSHSTPGIVQSIEVNYSRQLTVKLRGITKNLIIQPSTEVVGALAIGVKDTAKENSNYTVTVTITVVQYTAKGKK